MRTLAIGDIHGCSIAFNALLSSVAPNQDDLLITLGDYIDGGPDSAGVLDRLIELQTRTQLIALRGNHEEMLLRAKEFPNEVDLWLKVGGREALASYPGGDIPGAHYAFLETRCRDVFETDTHIFAHGGLDSELTVEAQPLHILRWKTFRDPIPHVSGKVLICGHSPQRDGRPADKGHSVCIDTGVVRPGGWLTCLDVSTGQYTQTNQEGRIRTGRIGD